MFNLLGLFTPEWGHTYLAEGFGKIYALRSLPEGSSLCLFDGQTGHPLGEYPTPGRHSSHITLLPRQAVVADYTSGSLSLFDLSPDGIPSAPPRLLTFSGHGPDPQRQQSPHVHSSFLAEGGQRLWVVDLGTDTLHRYRVADGQLDADSDEPVSLPPGCGPRMGVEHPLSHLLYVVTELSDEVLVCQPSATEGLHIVQRFCLHEEHPQGGAHIALSPDGHRLYATVRVSSTRGAASCTSADRIATFRINSDGTLAPPVFTPTGAHPRHFSLSPGGDLLCVACRDDNCLLFYALDPSSGIPTTLIRRLPAPAPVFAEWRGWSHQWFSTSPFPQP